MRSRSIVLVLAAVALALPPFALAQIQQAGKGKSSNATNATPDFSGVWQGRGAARGAGYVFTKDPLPMQPWAEKQYNYNKSPKDPLGHPRNEVDPTVTCQVPPGPTWIMTPPRPFEIIQIPGRVIMLYEWDHWWRDIWMDAQHPKDLKPTWMGHSIGKWDGDTLVIDTTGIRAGTMLDGAGHVHSDALHVIERIRRVDPSTLQDDMTFEDPKAYTKPFTGQYRFALRPGWDMVEEARCEERWQELPLTF